MSASIGPLRLENSEYVNENIGMTELNDYFPSAFTAEDTSGVEEESLGKKKCPIAYCDFPGDP